jgi:hypothetical protein
MSEENDPHKSSDSLPRPLKSNINDLDADTREKLIQLRHRDFESTLDKKSNIPNWAPLPIICFITALIFISLVYVNPKPGADKDLEDLEILISKDPIEFYENLEFLQKWNNSESEKKGL